MNKPTAAIIGSGFGGLAAAIRLQGQGFDVTVFEKRDLPGGRAYVYKDNGFTFDAGPTVITAPDCLRELWAVHNRRMEDDVELLPVRPLYRLHWEDGDTFDYTNDLPSTLRQISQRNEGDVVGYQAFLKYTEKVFEAGYTNLAHVPFLDWGSMIRVAPELMQLQAFRSVYAMVSKYIKDEKLRQAFSFHSLLVGGNPFSTSSIYTLIHFLERKWGVFFAKGGTGALVQAMVNLFEDAGGTIRYDSEIEKIETANGRVTGIVTKKGERQAFDIVVSNADVAKTYQDLLKAEPRVDATRAKVTKASYSMSLFVLYFGTNRRYPKLAHHNVIFGRRYKELLKDIFKKGVLADDFSLYLHAPSITDESLAPPGSEAFYALSPVPNLDKYDGDWTTEGPKYADKILSYLEERYMPGLRQHIVTQRTFTPLDFKSELNAHLGSAFSLEPLLRQSAYFRVHNRDADLNGLYFAGAGTHPGAGVPGVVNSAKATVSLIVEDWKRSRAVEVRSPKVEEALTHCREMINVGSKSFSMAAKLFDPETRDAAFFLYGWCRYCDDQIDQTMNLRLQEQRVEWLREATRVAFDGEPAENPVFIALSHVAHRYRIPSHYALELIEGMEMDVRKERYWTAQDLVLYCYRVAGTVGLMMSHVMGISDERALKHAADLGTAMQMTNIARDVLDDAEMGRVYLPLAWLDEAGVPENQIKDAKYREAIFGVVQRLLDTADGYYRSGNAGLRYLPFRAAFAVAVASRVYSEIGRQVRLRGSHAWDTRTVVSPGKKLLAVFSGLVMALKCLPGRITRPWRSNPILRIWRFDS